jgi:hypothetical protein
MKKITALLLFIPVFTLILRGDIYIKKEHRSTFEKQNQENKHEDDIDMIHEIWIGNDYYLLNMDGTSMTVIVDLNKKKFYMLDHAAKTFEEKIYDVKEIDKALTEENIHELKKEIKDYTSKIKVQPIKEKKKIHQWLCQGYGIKYKESDNKEITTEVWVTKDVPFDWKWVDQLNELLFSEKMIQFKQYLEEDIKTPEIEGFIIEVNSTIKMGEDIIYTSERVVEISQRLPPKWKDTFQRDYKQVNEEENQPNNRRRS